MTVLEKALQKIHNCIDSDTYVEVETDRLEFKDLSNSDNWNKLYESICAFLNTNGGIAVIGISEVNNTKDKSERRYKFTGFNYSNQEKLKQISKQFSDAKGLPLDLSNYFPSPEISDFADGKIAVIYVEKLPEDEKYVFFKGNAFARILEGDVKITPKGIEEQEERKKEYQLSQELDIVSNANLSDLNIDKLNEYITALNKGKKVESLKPDLASAKAFLTRKFFIRDGHPTILGMFVCGDYVEDFIPGKCQVDCYVLAPKKVAQNQQIFKDNLIGLLEATTAFVYQNIQVGVSRMNSGTALPEYPEELIEEAINNALAHRDYKSTRFTLLEIKPFEYISIQNPGSFQQLQRIYLEDAGTKIRRIIPIQHARNPKLTDLLKSFKRWEGKGKGMTSLTDACLENLIDLPYYVLKLDEVKLYIPSGKVFDDKMEVLFDGFSAYILEKYGRALNTDEKVVLSYFLKSEQLNSHDFYTILLTSDNNHKQVIAELERKELIFKSSQSLDIYPIYLVDRLFLKSDFSDELKVIFGKDWHNLTQDYRDVLEVIYQFNKYGTQPLVSANFVATTIFKKRFGSVSDILQFEKYRTKVRGIFNRLERNRLIVRKQENKPDFSINESYADSLNPSLFN